MYVHPAYTYYMLFDLSFYQYLVSEDYKEAASFFDCRSPNAARFNWTSDGIKEFFVRDSCKDPWCTGRFRAVNLLGLLQIAVMHFVSFVSELLIMSLHLLSTVILFRKTQADSQFPLAHFAKECAKVYEWVRQFKRHNMEINGAACFKLDERNLEACQSILLKSFNLEPVSVEKHTRTNQQWEKLGM